MNNLNVQTVIHAVDCQVVNGDVVLCQVLFVVQMVFIVVLKDIHVMCQREPVRNLTKLQDLG